MVEVPIEVQIASGWEMRGQNDRHRAAHAPDVAQCGSMPLARKERLFSGWVSVQGRFIPSATAGTSVNRPYALVRDFFYSKCADKTKGNDWSPGGRCSLFESR